MSNTLIQLETLIKNHKNATERELLFAAYEKRDFNLLFRRAASIPATFNVVEFLCTNQAEFVLNVNAAGSSGKNALEIAIEFACINTVTYFLGLKEIEFNIDNLTKLQKQFGNEYIQNLGHAYLASTHEVKDAATVCLQFAAEVNAQKLTASTIVNLSMISFIENIQKKNAPIDFFTEFRKGMQLYETIFKAIDIPFEDLNRKHKKNLSCFYAMEKVYPPIVAIGDPDPCGPTILLLNKFKEELIVFLDQSSQIIKSGLVQYIEELDKPLQKESLEITQSDHHSQQIIPSSKPSFFHEPARVENLITLQTKEPILTKTTENSPQAPEFKLTPKPNLDRPLKSLHEEKPKPVTKSNTEQADKHYCALVSLLDEIIQLKQKGQIKLTDFTALIQKINKEVDLVLKKTKSGGLVEYKENSFSFHNPHKKEGVDKKALKSLQYLVENEIEVKKPSL